MFSFVNIHIYNFRSFIFDSRILRKNSSELYMYFIAGIFLFASQTH